MKKFAYYAWGSATVVLFLVVLGAVWSFLYEDRGITPVIISIAVFLLFCFFLCALRRKAKGAHQPFRFAEKWKELAAKLAEKSKSQPAIGNDEIGEYYDPGPKNSMERWQDGLFSVWEGDEEITFSYRNNKGHKTRRTLTLNSVLESLETGNLYLSGFCHLKEEDRIFNVTNISSKITHKGKRYDWEDFIENELGIDLGM